VKLAPPTQQQNFPIGSVQNQYQTHGANEIEMLASPPKMKMTPMQHQGEKLQQIKPSQIIRAD
jgi:hypothetical protein